MKVKYVTTRPPSPPSNQFELFDVSFPEKLLKIVATRGEIFSLKFTNTVRRALWELKRSPDSLAAIRGPTSKGREREGRGGKGWGGEGSGKGVGREGKGGERGEEGKRGKGAGTP